MITIKKIFFCSITITITTILIDYIIDLIDYFSTITHLSKTDRQTLKKCVRVFLVKIFGER